MARPELPVDHTVPARGRLADALRALRLEAGLTYDELAAKTGLSAATLKRATSGRTVPALKTAEAVADACSVDHLLISRLWRAARVADRGRLGQLRRPPGPYLLTTLGELSAALEYFYEEAGAPSLRLLAQRAGGTHLLPVSSAARIVNRQALPVSRQQLVAFLTGCGLTGSALERWGDAFEEITVYGKAAVRTPVPSQVYSYLPSDPLSRLKPLQHEEPVLDRQDPNSVPVESPWFAAPRRELQQHLDYGGAAA